MSLINQVLQDVEKRQGMSQPSGLGAQVRPVLGEPARQHVLPAVAKGLLGLGLLAGLAYGDLRPGWFSGYLATVPATSVAQPTQVAIAPAAVVQAPASATPDLTQAEGPQLTRQLFSDWQQTSAGQSDVSGLTRTEAQPASVKSATPPATPALVAVIDNGAKPAGKTVPAKGVVSKQMQPEQEANVLIQRAVDHEQKGRTSEALALLRQAVQQYPQSEDARQLLVSYLLESRQDTEALTLLQEGIRAYPEQLLLRKSLAKWQLSHEQPQKALETLKPAAPVSAQDAEWQWMMAMASQHAGYHSDALPYFEHALTLQPGQVQTYVAYAVSLQATGQNRQALEQLRLAQDLPMSERMAEFVNQRMRQLSQQE